MENKVIPVIVTLSSYTRGENSEKEQPIRLMCQIGRASCRERV